MTENLTAVRNALSFLGSTSAVKTASNVVPTSKTRSALDLLASSSSDQLRDHEINLRELSNDLFNWSGKARSNKNVMRALNTALQTEGKYSHAVEITAYVAALAPFLEADRLARIFGAMNEVSTAFAPAKYTLQLSRKIGWLLERYPEERREKLAYSLWVEAHQGRWWDITAGRAPAGAVDAEPVEFESLIESFMEFKLPWTPANAEHFSQIAEDDRIREALKKYNDFLMKEKIMDPDVALYASMLPWLSPSERPESPVGSLLDTIKEIVDTVDYDLPEKPKKFADLFPDIKLYGGNEFPFPYSVLDTDSRNLIPNVRMELVRNATVLADNRTYMGNCTWSYKNRMEKGEYALYRLHHDGEIYNAAMTLNGNAKRWSMGEINSRFNRGQVPHKVAEAFKGFVNKMPQVTADTDYLKDKERQDKLEKLKTHKYKFKI